MNAQLLANVQNFTRNRLIELCGFLLVIFSTFLLISILSYSPSDPNFIYSSEKSDFPSFIISTKSASFPLSTQSNISCTA